MHKEKIGAKPKKLVKMIANLLLAIGVVGSFLQVAFPSPMPTWLFFAGGILLHFFVERFGKQLSEQKSPTGEM